MWTNNPYPHQIIMKPGLYVHLIESDNDWRVVHTDGRPHKRKEDHEPLYNGDQTSRAGRATRSSSTPSRSTNDVDHRNGWFHSDQAARDRAPRRRR